MGKPVNKLWALLVVLLLSGPATSAWAQNFEILDQRLDEQRHGYTVIRLWGSHYEMGYGMGAAFAGDIIGGLAEVKADTGGMYPAIRAIMETTVWLPIGIEDEISGIVDGVKSVHPNEPIDALDVKVMNTYSDWAYPTACRSHSCWGDFVQDPVKTLSTRRLDYGTPFQVALHHVLAAWEPNDGSVRWVNMAMPGYVAVITGINAYGTLVSLHDYNSSVSTSPGLVARSVATRHILTGLASPSIADHRDWAQGELNNINVATSTFINDFVPEGHGSVFTCPSGGPCGAPRTPQTDYFGGQVLITTNAQTDGHSVPGGGDFMHDYYQAGGVKTLQSHFDLMDLSGLHLVSVEVRGTEDMTIWAHGRGRTDLIQTEWATLFPQSNVGGGSSSSSGTGGASGSSDADPKTTTESCGCRTAGRTPSTPWLWLGLALLLMRRRRQQAN